LIAAKHVGGKIPAVAGPGIRFAGVSVLAFGALGDSNAHHIALFILERMGPFLPVVGTGADDIFEGEARGGRRSHATITVASHSPGILPVGRLTHPGVVFAGLVAGLATMTTLRPALAAIDNITNGHGVGLLVFVGTDLKLPFGRASPNQWEDIEVWG